MIEDHLRLMLEATPACVTLYDKNNTLIDCNMEAVKMFGYEDRAKFIKDFNENFFDLSAKYQPCGTPTTEKKDWVFREAYLKGRIQLEWTHLTIDGKEIPTHATLTKVETEDSHMIVTFVKDLRKREQNFGGQNSLSLDVLSNQAYINGEVLNLTNIEFKLLYLCMQNEGKTMSYETIYETIWKRPLANDKNAVQAAIKRLRKKIASTEYDIYAIRGKGYVFEKG